MATYSGTDGVIKIGTSGLMGEVKSFSVEQTSDTVEDTVMGDAWRTHKPSLKSWTGSADVLFDPDDTNGQVACAIGTQITVSFQVEGNTVGDHKLSGSAIITAKPISTTFDGLVELSITFQGTGALTEGLVTA
jgi:predicted secreted protein